MTYIQSFRTMLISEDTKIPQAVITEPADVAALMTEEYHLDSLPTEEIWAVFLNTKGYVIGIQMIGKGGLRSAVCEPRCVFIPALNCNAASVIIVHLCEALHKWIYAKLNFM